MVPAPDQTGGDFDPFFKADIIGKLGSTGTITVLGGPEEVESEFSDAQIPIKFKGKKYSMGLKWNSGNHTRLFRKFGSNPKKWKGSVKVEVKHFKKNDYVAVV
jgi:hypothetical protein